MDNVNGNVYQVVFDYSPAQITSQLLPLQRTVLHFAIDNIDNPLLGYGRAVTETYETDQAIESEILPHEINFDVGAWASAKTGGSSSRLELYQLLTKLFQGVEAKAKCFEATDGIEIMSFNGGRFFVDRINDLEVYRIIGAELVVKVYGAESGALGTGFTPYTIEQNAEMTIQDSVIIDTP